MNLTLECNLKILFQLIFYFVIFGGLIIIIEAPK